VVCLLVLASGRAAFAQGVPSPWVVADIGNPSPASSVTYDGQAFSISAAGADIWGSADQFNFIYQPVSGDVDVIARVDSISETSIWSKTGVMIRADLTAGSAHAHAVVSAAKGLAFQRRLTKGAASSNTYGENAVAPRWVKLTRRGTTVTGYTSANGTTWTRITSATIALSQTAYVGIATTSRLSGSPTHATVSKVQVSPLSMPAGTTSVDIGSPATAGSSTVSNGTYTVKGAGTDIWNTSDQFRFVYQQVTGDVDISARIASYTPSSTTWAKAGVMIRESLNANARNTLALTQGTRGYSYQWRLDAAGLTDGVLVGAGAPPGWVRLKRVGSRIEAFRSTDGQSWVSIGVQTVPMADAVYVGLAVSSRTASATATAVFDNLKINATSAPPNQLPVVTLTAPASGGSYTAPATIPVSATASDPENRLARVEFNANGNRIGTDTTAPFSISWTSVAAGTYSVNAVAFDNDGASATSPAVTITVGGTPNQLPTVSLTAPANGASYTAPATVNITASAADPENRLARVEFYVGSTLVSTDSTSPFAATWTTSTAGTYVLKAIAYDSNGGVKSSATRSITVTASAPTPAPKMVSFTANSDHATAVTKYRLDIFASGANPLTATPLKSSDLGKPTPDASSTITVDRGTFFATLAAGSYVATVSAVGPGGESRSTSITFNK
jgi:regulation of enolase protein 1 (concanavalin A-like superfamily)